MTTAPPPPAPPAPRGDGVAGAVLGLGPLVALALVLLHSLRTERSLLLLAASALLLLLTARRAPRVVAGIAAAALVVESAAALHLRAEPVLWPRRSEAHVQARLAAVEDRARAIVARLQADADAVAGMPDTVAALRGDQAALTRLFGELEARAGREARSPSLAVHAIPLSTLAWSGRSGDPAVFEGLVGDRKGVFLLGGTVTTTLVASSPVHQGAGPLLGVVTAALPIAVRRNVRNEYLSDYDLLAGPEGGVEFRYVDARGAEEGPRPFPSPPTGRVFRDAILRAPDGSVLAAVRAVTAPPEEGRRDLETRYRSAICVLAVAALAAWGARPGARRGGSLARIALALVLARAVLLALSAPFPLVSPEVLSPDTYASPLLGPLLKSPVDLLLTAAAALGLAVVALAAVPRVGRPSAVRTIGGILVALPVVGATFFVLGDAVANCSLDLATLPLVPDDPARLVLQASLLAVAAAGGLAAATLVALGGPPPAGWVGRLVVGVVGAGLAALGTWAWPRARLPLPLVPALLLLVAAVAVGLGWPAARERLRVAPAPRAAAAALFAAAGLTAITYPAIVQFSARGLRTQIETSYAPLILRQPDWRAFVLRTTEARIDDMKLLEEAPPGIYYPGVEELAYAVWSATDLAAYGFSSAVEVQDPQGTVISRFALNLPSLSVPAREMPSGDSWAVVREPVGLASAEKMVLHAQRLLTYHGQVHGAIHVYVSEDFGSLPFVQGRDPYSILYRNEAHGGVPERPVALLAYDLHRDVVFSSLDRPPALDASLADRAERAAGAGTGFWTRLDVDDAAQDAYVFASDQLVYALVYRRLTPGRAVADLVEAVSAMTLLAAAVLLVIVLARSALGRPTLSLPSLATAVGRRFVLRLFVAFTLVAFLPAAVLQVVVSGFVESRLRREAEDQALDRAAVAKKVVEDYAFFQREEAQGTEAVSDAALVWVASVVKNELDVFVRGRLQASSKRELYASGLLAPRVSGSVYRAIVLEGQPATIQTERIGDFAYSVASVPVHLGGPEHGVLSMPLALREREVAATVDDLDRAIRLASVVFLGLAAALAQSMARRISEPIQALTRATRRIAQGDLEARVEATSQDELRRLVESFNQMAGDLDRQRKDLERSNRLAAWAEMARQVAHDVKNPLTPIQLSAEHLRRVWADRSADFASTLEECTSTILEQVRTLRGMVTEFSAFARPPAASLERQDPRGLLEEVVRPYRAGLPRGVRLDLDLDGAAPAVLADRRLLERALVNLLENALQAVGDAGTVTLALRAAGDGARVEFEVSDSGPGVPAEVRDRVFEPFFSTKTSGSGLGLALVKKIAEDHGGGVALRSAPGQPTRATLWLPAADRPEAARG